MVKALGLKAFSTIFLLAMLLCANSAFAAKKIALVIGTDRYDNLPTLQKAVNDARAVSSSLEKIGFTVIKGENLTRRQMNQTISNLERSISPGDQVFFFYAGHGLALGATNYLIPADMPLPKPGEDSLVRGEAFSVDSIVRRIQSRGAAASFIVLDACRDNPFKVDGVRSVGGTRGLGRTSTPKGVFVLYSAGIGQTALDRLSNNDPNPNSVFTRHLVPLLETPGLSHVQLAKQIQSKVYSLAGTVRHEQQPAYYDQVIGEIFLVNKKTKIASLPPKQQPVVQSQAAKIYAQIKGTNNTETLETFIQSFPDSFFAKLAKIKLKNLQKATKKSIAITKPRITQTPVDVTQCDRLADSPSDPNKLTAGVLWKNLDPSRAEPTCRAALEQHPETTRFKYLLGRTLRKANKFPEALNWYRKAAKLEHSTAMFSLGIMYQNGQGVEKSYSEASQWYRKAAKLGHSRAMFQLALFYANGKGVEKSSTEARRWYRKSVKFRN